jgi:hypothetical protein
MEPPVFDINEPAYAYVKKLEMYLNNMKRDKYIHALNFMNKLVKAYGKSKLKALSDFKDVTYITNDEINHEVLTEYGAKTASLLKITFDFDEDELDETSLYTFLNLMLRSVEYRCDKRMIDNKTYYTIVNRPCKPSSVKNKKTKADKPKTDKTKTIKK